VINSATVVFFNYTTMQMTAKIVYYGPGLCGKTTNLQAIHHRTAPQSRGEMVSLETETDRTLFFDLLPLEVGVIGGMKVRLQLYTVPGQVFYNATRKLVLKGVDGVVFVADSQKIALDANVESLSNLRANFAELGLTTEQVPVVFQYNKRDIRNILPVDTLEKELNPEGARHFEAAALHGVGVFETLKAISKVSITTIRKKLSGEEARPSVSVPGSVLPTLESLGPPAESGDGGADAARAMEDLVSADTGVVEFAQEDTAKHVIPVKTKGEVDIQRELEKLRAMTAAPAPARVAPASSASGGRDIERRLKEMTGADQSVRQQIKRKAAVEVPGGLLKGGSGMKILLAFTDADGQEVVHEAAVIGLRGNQRLEWLALQLELDVKGKG
jgi:signal recognition particle receptor subunit beta